MAFFGIVINDFALAEKTFEESIMTASTRAGIPEEGHTPLSRFRRDSNRWESVYDTKRNDDGAHATNDQPSEFQAF